MEDKELVIKIPEELISKIDDENYQSVISWFATTLYCAIKDGTPLPKGHGRIGDLDALREEVSSWGMNDYEPSDFIDEIDRANTIIEAEKEQENGNDGV